MALREHRNRCDAAIRNRGTRRGRFENLRSPNRTLLNTKKLKLPRESSTLHVRLSRPLLSLFLSIFAFAQGSI